jgi:hypothetical protein
MPSPKLHDQLFQQLRQLIIPEDLRHLKNYAELVGAILQSQSACASHWIPYLSHRNCQARSHLERVHYFMHNRAIEADRFYAPLVELFLAAWQDEAMTLTLDTSVLWDKYCLIEITLIWGGRAITLAQSVLEHGSATVGFWDYLPVLEAAQARLPDGVTVTLLADRGFEHGELIRWLNRQGWHWAIRAKSDLQVSLGKGIKRSVSQLLAPIGEAYFYPKVEILEDIACHLATAHLACAKDTWAVITDQTPSLQTFALYGQRFGGIEPHFKDYKSAGFHLVQSRLDDVHALNCLLMLLASAHLLAMVLGFYCQQIGQRTQIDWHGQRGLSFLQLGLRALQRLCYLALPLPIFESLPYCHPPPVVASRRKQDQLAEQIEFSRVVTFVA